MAERIRAPNSITGVSVQQSVGYCPGRDTCVPEQDTCFFLFASPSGYYDVMYIRLESLDWVNFD